jgi:hypothetical protein
MEEIVGGSCRLGKFIYKKQSIIQITNKDNLCSFRAVVVGIAHNNYLQDKKKTIKASIKISKTISKRFRNKFETNLFNRRY